jgi:hypothetical protein
MGEGWRNFGGACRLVRGVASKSRFRPSAGMTVIFDFAEIEGEDWWGEMLSF